MTTGNALTVVYERVREIFPLYPIFKQEKPDDESYPVWIVINTLPMSERDGDQNKPITQELSMNINIHVKDLKKGITDWSTLDTLSETLIAELPFELGSLVAYYGRDNTLRELDKQSHFQNVQINVTLINY